MKRVVIFLAATIMCFSSSRLPTMRAWTLTGSAQGTTYHITYYATDSFFTQSQADSILTSLDSSLSLYRSYSLVNAFNNSSGGIKADEHLRRVVQKAQEVYTSTSGAFDITVWPLVNAWGFGTQKTTGIPDTAAISRLMPCIGSDKLQWSGPVLQKRSPCVQLDVNGIAQGYSVDVLSSFMESKGIVNYIVELGGEIRVNGKKQPGNSSMKIGIESPGDNEFEEGLMQRIIMLDKGAITTSGSYRKFYESKGRRVTHIIDPRTGASIQNELISVTVMAPDAITADAYDNALMVLGLEKGLRIATHLSSIEAYFIYRTPQGKIADTATAGFYTLIQY